MLNNPSKFDCDGCGECCRHINYIPQLSDFDNGSGVCIHLVGNLCDIYENRPEICRVDVMYEKYYSAQYTREEFYSINQSVCKILKSKGYKSV